MIKILMVSFHCDNCGKTFHVTDTEVEKEFDGKYHCIFCGTKGKNVYVFDDYFVQKIGGKR